MLINDIFFKVIVDKLQKLQNRTCGESFDFCPAMTLVPTLSYSAKFKRYVMIYKSLHGLARRYLRSMFTDRSTITNYTMRTSLPFLNFKPRTHYLKDSFSYSGEILWNDLPIGSWQANTSSEQISR